jgi:polysaccharide export outer membrane protein
MTLMRAVILLAGVLFFTACSTYRKSLYLKVDRPEQFPSAPSGTHEPADPVLRPFDQFNLEVYAANGELLIDPENALANAAKANTKEGRKLYTLDKNGNAYLPMIGEVALTQLNLRQAEALLREKYNAFYKDCFVALTITSHRVTVISNSGVMVPLQHQSLTLLEVIALAGEVAREGNTRNIRVLRGDEVMVIDLSKIASYPAGNIVMRPGDIVYIEPVKRPFAEGVRDISPLLGLLVGILTLVWLLSQ